MVTMKRQVGRTVRHGINPYAEVRMYEYHPKSHKGKLIVHRSIWIFDAAVHKTGLKKGQRVAIQFIDRDNGGVNMLIYLDYMEGLLLTQERRSLKAYSSSAIYNLPSHYYGMYEYSGTTESGKHIFTKL